MGAPELPGALETVMSLGSGYGVLGRKESSGDRKEGREDGEEAIRYCGTHMGDPNTNVYIFAGGRYRPREY